MKIRNLVGEASHLWCVNAAQLIFVFGGFFLEIKMIQKVRAMLFFTRLP